MGYRLRYSEAKEEQELLDDWDEDAPGHVLKRGDPETNHAREKRVREAPKGGEGLIRQPIWLRRKICL